MDFEQLRQACTACEKCGLCDTRQHVVFGMGNPEAEVMFIGEGPGQNEDEQGLPFVGRSGKLLDQYLEAVDLYRDKNIFITNIVKCRPPGCGNSSGSSGPASSCAWAASPPSG